MFAPVPRVLHRDEGQSPLFQSYNLVLLLFPKGLTVVDFLLLLLSPRCGFCFLLHLVWVLYTEFSHLLAQFLHLGLVASFLLVVIWEIVDPQAVTHDFHAEGFVPAVFTTTFLVDLVPLFPHSSRAFG